MSSSPRSLQVTHDMVRGAKRRDRPSVLDIDSNPTDDLDALPRSGSATSSLDPYYFTIHTPSESPVPSLPASLSAPKTPDIRHNISSDPVTPGRDPAAIDRRGLVGVGELATPRWTRAPRSHEDDDHNDFIPSEPLEEEEPDFEQDPPDSPWTIEAVDGDGDEDYDHVPEVPSIVRTIRPRPSIAEESGGEEILYPRYKEQISFQRQHSSEASSSASTTSSLTVVLSDTLTESPQSRASVELHIDTVSPDSPEDKASVRRHKSLGVGHVPNHKIKERRRETFNSSKDPGGGGKHEKHSRHPSASSSSSSHETSHARRVHTTTDFSHLPPSPSSFSIPQFLRSPNSGGSVKDLPHSSNVAQSLLRGTQEGWSAMDDEATAEALRKLDGLSEKSAHANARISVGSSSRAGSRPGTREGIVMTDVKRSSKRASTHIHLDEIKRDSGGQNSSKHADRSVDSGSELPTSVVLSDDPGSSQAQEKSPKKTSIRTSYTPKRGSTSSTNYTSNTPSSRDSGSMSVTTSMTSLSAGSIRHSLGKSRRNSTDASVAGDSASDKDRSASAVQDTAAHSVPPVPPLPKDLTSYRASQPLAIPPHPDHTDDEEASGHDELDFDRTVSMDAPSTHMSRKDLSPVSPVLDGNEQSLGYLSTASVPLLKTPSKKWSFTTAFRLSNSPSTASMKEKSRVSPRPANLLRKSSSKDRSLASAASEAWSTIQRDAMTSATSLVSVSSVGSPSNPAPPYILSARSPDNLTTRPQTASSVSTGHTASAPSLPHVPLSPTLSIHRGSSKRLTPSSIPFFRRSSSQSMHFPASSAPMLTSTSPTVSSGSHTSLRVNTKMNSSPSKDPSSALSTPATHRKSSVLGLGIPSLLRGSSSRKSLHGDKSDAGKDPEKEGQKANQKEKEKEKEKEERKLERSRSKKEDKDRSESRISVLMGRKRGKTMSSAEPKKAKPVSLPPMQVSALPPATVHRVASLKTSNSSLNSVASQNSRNSTNPSSNRATSQTTSSMQKVSDTSLRRNQLPTIAGSPSVGTTVGHNASKGSDGGPPSTSNNSASALSKETPTKIPRIASRSSTVNSPTLKNRHPSIHTGATSADPSPVQGAETANEFGVLEGQVSTSKLPTSIHSFRASPSTTSVSRVPRQSTQSSGIGSIPRKANRESISFGGLRKASAGSITSTSTAVQATPSTSHHRFSALSPSKGLKLLSPKVSLSAARTANSSSQSYRQSMVSPSVSQQSLSTPSPSPSVDEDELAGDEEMLLYIRRQQAKKLAHGASQEELDEMLKFPEPLPPVPASSPTAILNSSQAQFLSEYERKEILDYPDVYYTGARSDKKRATPENSTNNHSYDDERGDYLVINHDHLAYRYEIMDTLGKGSFGQVLNCRDHCTGESVAIKIIRNKKRFHHQALVEIKILDNLRKWDPEEKHFVIKMTEHFYFRNHLCIAMELLSINLYELIKANGFVGFSTALIRRFTHQMLMSLSLMRHHRIVHCDLKPENVLLRHPAKSGIKVIDFGSSCLEHEKIYTYIQSRFYRSPEVILGMNYHMAIDMWSLGCILAELYTGFPIFPGENEQEQLSCIMEVLGVPDKDFVNRSSRKRLFFDSTGAPRPVVNSKGRRRRPGTKTLQQVLRCDDQPFVDFISKCLTWDPERRMKPQQALRHEFVTAGKRQKAMSTSASNGKLLSGYASNLSSSTRSKPTETPKKSQIGAPTPLTARSARTAATGNVPSTPSGLSSMTLGSSSRLYRASQPQSFAAYHTARTLNSLASTAKMS